MKKHIELARKNKEVSAEAWNRVYENLVVKKIRTRYSVNQELAILRQRDTKPKEFSEYNTFVEACKYEARMEMGI